MSQCVSFHHGIHFNRMPHKMQNTRGGVEVLSIGHTYSFETFLKNFPQVSGNTGTHEWRSTFIQRIIALISCLFLFQTWIMCVLITSFRWCPTRERFVLFLSVSVCPCFSFCFILFCFGFWFVLPFAHVYIYISLKISSRQYIFLNFLARSWW